MSALLKASRNDAIIARCLQTISQLIPLTSAVFYRVNNRLKPENYILHNISDNTHQQYLENFQPLDPLLPSHFSQKIFLPGQPIVFIGCCRMLIFMDTSVGYIRPIRSSEVWKML